MKQILKLNSSDHSMIITAMTAFRQELEGMGQLLFDIAFNKLREAQPSVELDGMEMIYVTQSLNKYGKQLREMDRLDQSERYRLLGAEIERVRFNFQYTNGPKIGKKKAASA
ncbi:hypothetical protein [Bacillus infantis]|uniref:Uncharacterized protein n=1 Tax=Bacillus infantis TaxID=324767 RepID=A0A5D4RF71_9BACI|nr:hypothetical protein [Bacillus infantis]TYS50113.1 hypothetical protein FZD51_06050 [Bacillus infantis]